MIKNLCYLVVSILLLSSCTPWPKQGTGGYAQRYIFTPGYQNSLYKDNYAYFLSHRLRSLTLQGQAVAKSHASRCYPARFRLLNLLAQRIAQEIASGQFVAARADMYLYKKNIENIRLLNRHKGCPRRPKKDPYWEYLKSREQ